MRKRFAVASMVPIFLIAAAGNPFHKKIPKDSEAIHALNRLTFGPRPGDIEAVRKIGVKKWVEMQLNPQSIPENPKLESSLKLLDSLRMSTSEMIENYPDQTVIQAAVRGNAPMPTDPILRARLERVTKRYKARMDGASPAPPKGMDQVLDANELTTFRSASPAERAKFLASMPDGKFADVVDALPPKMRQGMLFMGSPELRRKVMVNTQPQQVVQNDLMEGKLLRAIYSNRQLEEVLVDFWYNHFNVFLDKGLDRVLVTSYERDAIRPHVLGKFKDMLTATAENPAMLFYLDNWQSVANGVGFGKQKRGLNENYARELLELHTLGVDGGYTQKDIIEVARCFTGWTLKQPRQGGGFDFNMRMHDKGEKTVLGVKIAAGGGKEDGMKVLDIVAHHPSTARFLSKKLAMRFVSDDPPKELIDHMAKTYADTDGDLKAMMRTMFNSKEFWSEGAFHAKMKSPLEMVVSAVRATGAEVNTTFSLVQQLQQLGQPLYRKIEPTGYSSANAEWTSSAALLARMNFALALAQNKVPGLKVDTSQFTKAAVADVIAKELLFRESSPTTRAALQKETAPEKIAGLVLGSPEFQRR
jgi:uncharacterized protein (DUF1800 family)